MEPEEQLTLKELEERERFLHPLTREPATKDDIVVHISYPDVRKNKTKNPNLRRNLAPKAEYVAARGKHYARLNYGPQVALMKGVGVKGPWDVNVVVEYSVSNGDQQG